MGPLLVSTSLIFEENRAFIDRRGIRSAPDTYHNYVRSCITDQRELENQLS